MRKFLLSLIMLLFCTSCFALTEKEFRVQHLRAVAIEARTWDIANPKLMDLYKLVGGEVVARITEKERWFVILRLLELADRTETAEITCDSGCGIDILLFHAAGEYEVHNLLGGFKMIYYCETTNCAEPIVYIEKDGERVELEY